MLLEMVLSSLIGAVLSSMVLVLPINVLTHSVLQQPVMLPPKVLLATLVAMIMQITVVRLNLQKFGTLALVHALAVKVMILTH